MVRLERPSLVAGSNKVQLFAGAASFSSDLADTTDGNDMTEVAEAASCEEGLVK